MPINGPFKNDKGLKYWTIDNVVDGKGNLVHYYSREKALKALAAIKINQKKNKTATMSSEDVEEMFPDGIVTWLTEIEASDIERVMKEANELVDVELARVGVYNTSTGRWIVNEEMLEEMVGNFDPDDPIPGNVDHVNEGEAKGWITSLRKVGESLFATISDITDEFMERLKNKEFATRSVEGYKSKNGWVLNGFAWLGAKRPAMKKLTKLQIADGEEVELFYADLDTERITGDNADAQRDGRLNGASGDKLDIDSKTKQEDDSMPPEVAEELKVKLADETAARKTAEENVKAAETKVKDAEKARKAVEVELLEANRATALIEANQFVDDQIKVGRITPAMQKAGLPELIVFLNEQENELEIKATDDKGKETVVKATALDMLKGIIEAIPEKALINFNEETAHAKQGAEGETTEDNADLVVKLEQYKKEHPDATHVEAVKAVNATAAAAGRKMVGPDGRPIQ